MKSELPKLATLQEELRTVIEQVKAGTLGNEEAADKIIEIRSEISQIIRRLKSPSSVHKPK